MKLAVAVFHHIQSGFVFSWMYWRFLANWWAIFRLFLAFSKQLTPSKMDSVQWFYLITLTILPFNLRIADVRRLTNQQSVIVCKLRIYIVHIHFTFYAELRYFSLIYLGDSISICCTHSHRGNLHHTFCFAFNQEEKCKNGAVSVEFGHFWAHQILRCQEILNFQKKQI